MRASRPIRTLGLALMLVLAALAFRAVATQAQTGDPLEQGQRLYTENCAVCHGANGEGRVGATLNKNWPAIRPDLTVKTIIQNGVPGSAMLAWSQAKGGPLSDGEIEALMTYILSWQNGGTPQITPSPTATPRPPITPISRVEGDPNRGAVLFDQNCALCHGLEGEGRIGATLAKNWPAIWPDLAIKSASQSGVPGSLMPAWSQANGGPLSETEIDDLVAFILTLSEEGRVVQASPTVIAPDRPSNPLLRGWGGVLLFATLFIAIVAAALFIQRRS